jgi:hypothetical protein
MAIVAVDEYVPAKAFAGTATWIVALTVFVPSPVAVAAFSHLTAAGATVAAGTERLVLATAFVGGVHVELAPQVVLTAVIVDAATGKVCPAPSLKVVEVMVRFQPPPTASPRASTTLTGSV